MIVFDTDHVNILQIGRGEQFAALMSRMENSVDRHFTTTIITVEEHMRGWLASIRRAKTTSQQIAPYSQLTNLVHFFQGWQLLPFDVEAAERFNDLRRSRIRDGTQDLKIASIALTHDALLITANERDFERVPSLQIEDWRWAT